jgi:hypothetical protein
MQFYGGLPLRGTRGHGGCAAPPLRAPPAIKLHTPVLSLWVDILIHCCQGHISPKCPPTWCHHPPNLDGHPPWTPQASHQQTHANWVNTTLFAMGAGTSSKKPPIVNYHTRAVPAPAAANSGPGTCGKYLQVCPCKSISRRVAMGRVLNPKASSLTLRSSNPQVFSKRKHKVLFLEQDIRECLFPVLKCLFLQGAVPLLE